MRCRRIPSTKPRPAISRFSKRRQGDFTAALPLWEAAFKHDPGASAAGIDLAVAQCRLGEAGAAAETLQRALLFSPDNDAARNMSLALARGTQRCGAP